MGFDKFNKMKQLLSLAKQVFGDRELLGFAKQVIGDRELLGLAKQVIGDRELLGFTKLILSDRDVFTFAKLILSDRDVFTFAKLVLSDRDVFTFADQIIRNRELISVIKEPAKAKDFLATVKQLLACPDLQWITQAIIASDSLEQMLKDLLAENNIRDQFYPIARRYIKEKSYRVLINKLVELINSFPENAGDVERLISTLKTKQDFDIYGFFAKWYPNQPDEFHKAIEQLFLNEDLIKMFHIALSEWANNLTLNFSQSRSKIRELYLAEIYHGIGDIRIPVGTIHEESHHSNHADMAYVCAIAAFIKAVNIFEFGTYRGQTTCSLAGTGDNTRVYTLNLPPEYDPRYAPYIGKFIQKSPFKQRIIQLFDDSLKFDTSPYAKKMDYIFIDADHSYEYVKNDTEKALDMLRPGGVIVWHDYAAKSPGVYKFIQEFSCKRPVFRIRNTCLIAYLDGVDALTFSPAVIPDSLENEVSERDRFKTN